MQAADPDVTIEETTVFTRFPWLVDGAVKATMDNITRQIVEARYGALLLQSLWEKLPRSERAIHLQGSGVDD